MRCAAAASAIAKTRKIDHTHAADASQSSAVSLPLVFWPSLLPSLCSSKFSTAFWMNTFTGGTSQSPFCALLHLLSEQFSSSDSSPRTNRDPELECGLLWCWLSSHSVSLQSGISSTSNGSTSMISFLPVLMSLDTPCKLRKHSWSGVCSLVSALTSPGHTSSALHPPMQPARMANKSQCSQVSTAWSQMYQVWEVTPNQRKAKVKKPPKVTKPPRISEHPCDLHDQSIYNFIWN